MSAIFFAIILIAFLVAGYRQITWVPDASGTPTPMEALTTGAVEIPK